MAEIDTSELHEAATQLRSLEQSLKVRLSISARVFVKNLVRKIEQYVRAVGLDRNATDNKPSQVDLIDSFDFTRRSKSIWRVFSTAPHAMAHEEGSGIHGDSGAYEIPPGGGEKNGNVIAFIPENPDKWGHRYDPDTGYVYTGVHNHPGVEGKGYIARAQSSWSFDTEEDLNQTVRRAIVMNGFKGPK
jgi:hypothetical protein